ncbi:alpha/beta hydrolase [Microbacterium sp. zg-YB36]|uniref:alpha/beta fold hydrolase n=1 Tax=Microbacterium sp. zg-YB36 TaxID=2969407 RepID=UPI00214B953E|nr:alpha/beta hydrolase [Microbacterium sp. zg-YB36]MDL5350986.1 alpha/beta hydrolase [Microbacterium sp. zg-YB36]
MDASHAGGPSAGTVAWVPPLPQAAGFEHVVIETPGLRSHVALVGEGPPVLLLHGFPQHWWQWREVAPAIARRGYRVICPDLRGAGWTSADDPRIRHETRMHDVLALLDALGVARADVLTHDLGALTGMHLAYAHPERVRTLVQLSVPPGFMRFTPKIVPAFRHYPSLIMSSPDRSLRWLLAPPYTVRPMTEETLDGYLRVEQRPEIRGMGRAVVLGMITPELPRLVGTYYKRRRLQPPTLVAFGRLDDPFTEPTVRGMCRDHERSAERFELAFVDDAAHFITDDAPDAVVELAVDWFGRGPQSAHR